MELFWFAVRALGSSYSKSDIAIISSCLTMFVLIIFVKRMEKDTKKTLAEGKTRACLSVLRSECICVHYIALGFIIAHLKLLCQGQ